jgi:prefoldin subunit 5
MEVTELEIRTKIDRYSDFLQNVLVADLKKATSATAEIKHEIDEFQYLERRLHQLLSKRDIPKVREMVDLGHGKSFCPALAADESMVHVHVGMGFYAELSISDALKFVVKRVLFLQNERLKESAATVHQLKDHILASELTLDQLSVELQRSLHGERRRM